MSTFLTSVILIIRLSFLFGVESTVLQIESNAHRFRHIYFEGKLIDNWIAGTKVNVKIFIIFLENIWQQDEFYGNADL